MALIYHYTSLSSFMGILQCNGEEQGPKDNLCFWGSRYDCMNDAIDCQYTLQYIAKVAKSQGLKSEYPRTIFPYVVSFCNDRDNLNMWRLYHSYICLILDKDTIAEHLDQNALHDCLYPEAEQDEDLNRLYRKTIKAMKDGDDNAWNNIQVMSAFVKHPSFKVENECRLARFFGSDGSIQGTVEFQDDTVFHYTAPSETCSDFSFRADGNNLIPYHKFYLPKEALKGVIIREYDKDKFERVKEHIKLVFQKRGIDVENSEIIPSSACKIN